MKNSNIKKRVVSLSACLAMLGGIGAIDVAASNDDIGYSFTIKDGYRNSYTSTRYRQTTNTANQWKNEFGYSGEGSNAITTFWLSRKVNGSYDQASDTYHMKPGNNYYKDAWSNASKKNVALSAESNNVDVGNYTVSGYWDEETN